MFCKKCGNEIPNDSDFCAKCGTKADKSEQYFVDVSATKAQIDDTVSAGLVILSVLIPLVGIIMGFFFHSGGKQHAGKTYVLAGVISAVVFCCIVTAIMLPISR